MSSRILRCHLLMGPPGSGKTTLAQDLASLIVGPMGQPAVVLSTDAIRAELFGDAAVQGPWPEIQQALARRLQEAVAPALHPGAHPPSACGMDWLVAHHPPAHLPGVGRSAGSARARSRDPRLSLRSYPSSVRPVPA